MFLCTSLHKTKLKNQMYPGDSGVKATVMILMIIIKGLVSGVPGFLSSVKLSAVLSKTEAG